MTATPGTWNSKTTQVKALLFDGTQETADDIGTWLSGILGKIYRTVFVDSESKLYVLSLGMGMINGLVADVNYYVTLDEDHNINVRPDWSLENDYELEV